MANHILNTHSYGSQGEWSAQLTKIKFAISIEVNKLAKIFKENNYLSVDYKIDFIRIICNFCETISAPKEFENKYLQHLIKENRKMVNKTKILIKLILSNKIL